MGKACRAHVQNGAAYANAIVRFGFDVGKPAAQANDNTRNTAIAHQQIRANADDINRNILWRGPEKFRKIGLIKGREQNFRRSSRAKPRQVSQRRIGFKAAANRRQPFDQSLTIESWHQGDPLPSREASWSGNA